MIVALLFVGVTPLSVFAQTSQNNSPVYTIIAGGDVMLGRRMAKNINKYANGDAAYPWRYITPTFADADISFVNLEGVASFMGKPLEKRYTFRFDPELLKGLVSAGVDVVSTANNHTLDYGYAGLCDSYKNITSLGLYSVGSGCNRAQAIEPAIRELPDGTRVAFIAMTEFYQGNTATKSRPGFAPFSLVGAIDLANQLKDTDKADIVIVSVHAGTEHVFVPPAKMIKMYHTLIDGGVDIVLGHHPHVPQPIESYNGGYIAYSLGNLIFDMHDVIPSTKKQILARIRIKNASVIGVDRIPIEMNDRFQPYLFVDKKKIESGQWRD